MFPSAEPTDPPPRPGGLAQALRPGQGWERFALLAPFLALLPLALFGLGTLLLMQSERAAHRRQDLRQVAGSVVLSLDAELRAGLRALEALAGSQHLESLDLDGFRNEAQRLLAREPNWFTIALTDGERQLLNLRYPSDAPLPPIQDLAAVGIVLRTGRSEPGGLFEGRISFRVAVRVDGAVRYALVATQEATSFSQLLNGVGVPDGWSAMLLDGAGRLVARGAGQTAEPDTLRDATGQMGRVIDLTDTLALALPLGTSRWSLVMGAPPSDFGDGALLWLLLALGIALLLSGFGLGAHQLRAQSGQDARRLHGHGEAMARIVARDARRNALIAAISEDMRAPLASLIADAERLRRSKLPEEALACVERQCESGQGLLNLVDDVLEFANLDRAGLQLEDGDVEIAPLLESCAAPLRLVAEAKGLGLHLLIDPGLPRWIRGDAARLRQLIVKLLEHAIRISASPDPGADPGSGAGAGAGGSAAGRIRLAARLTPRPDWVEMTIIDVAPTLPEAELARLFERFPEPTMAVGPQAGLLVSLAICRRIVDAMGGTLAAEALPDGGNRYQAILPFRPGAAPQHAHGMGMLRILVAEDAPARRSLLKSMLERAGHVVTEAEDGPGALAILRAGGIDMALLDLQMPSLGGLAGARAIRGLQGVKGRLPLIALTADPGDRMRADCLAAGFDAMLRKPHDSRSLVELIDSLRGRAAQIGLATEASGALTVFRPGASG